MTNIDIEEIKERVLKESIILEKSFFDLDQGDEESDDENTQDKDENEENKTDETEDDNDNSDETPNNPFEDADSEDSGNANISIQFKLQLKIIFTSIKNMLNIVKLLYIHNKDEFESIYDRYNRLYNYMKDFILNFNEFDDNKKVKIIKLLRNAFKLLNKKLYDKLQSL